MKVSNLNGNLRVYFTESDYQKITSLHGKSFWASWPIKNKLVIYPDSKATCHIFEQKSSKAHPYCICFSKIQGFQLKDREFTNIECEYEVHTNGISIIIPDDASVRFRKNKKPEVHVPEIGAQLGPVTLDEFHAAVKTVNNFLKQNKNLVTLDLTDGTFLRYLISNG